LLFVVSMDVLSRASGGRTLNDWQSTYLGRGSLPRDMSGFEMEAFFTYSDSERRVIDDERRTPAELIGRISPTRTEGINLRGVFSFPIEQYQAQLLPSLPAAKSRAFAG
jgi:hypothetical protein